MSISPWICQETPEFLLKENPIPELLLKGILTPPFISVDSDFPALTLPILPPDTGELPLGIL